MQLHPVSAPPGSAAVPLGWKVEWSAQYSRYFYVHLGTNESTWVLPTSSTLPPPPPPPLFQHVVQPVQRKPVPSQSQNLALSSVPSGRFAKQQLQTPGGYFSAPSAQSQTGCGQNYMAQQQQSSYQQPHAPYSAHQQSQFCAPPSGMQQFSPPPTPGTFQEQQRNFTPPSASLSTLNPQYSQQQNVGQTFKPGMYSPAQSNVVTPPLDRQQTNYIPPQNNMGGYHAPPPPQGQVSYYPQHQQNPVSHPQQQQQQQNYYPTQAHPQQQHQAQQTKRTSTLGSNLMGGSMMTKMSSKLTQFQKPAQAAPSPSHTTSRFGAPAAAQANGKPASSGSDWKKWGKRAAIGVAAVGALALGVDAMDGGIFDGAAAVGAGDFGGGGDLSGGDGDWAAGDAQTSLDASAAQLAMEQQGQENALMLADPAGTTYTVVDSNSLI
ncbi:WW domain-containing protein wwm1 [Ascochyta lentis]